MTLGPFSGGGPNGIFRTLKCTFGVSGFRGSVAGQDVCNAIPTLSDAKPTLVARLSGWKIIGEIRRNLGGTRLMVQARKLPAVLLQFCGLFFFFAVSCFFFLWEIPGFGQRSFSQFCLLLQFFAFSCARAIKHVPLSDLLRKSRSIG